jgi:hypothetical protein
MRIEARIVSAIAASQRHVVIIQKKIRRKSVSVNPVFPEAPAKLPARSYARNGHSSNTPVHRLSLYLYQRSSH